MAMKYSFAELANNILTRKFGGTRAGVADPYTTGTHFIWFDKLPDQITEYTREEVCGISDVSEVQNVLAATCLSVTPPGGTLNRIEFTGLGGLKWNVPGSVDYGTTVSVKFLEMNKTPILGIMHSWVKLIKDYRLGISDRLIDGAQGSGFTKKTYGALMYYWTTAPDGKTVEYYACYDGMFPTKDPQDLYGSDVETIGKLDVEIEFSIDYNWHEPWVLNKCQTFANRFAERKSVVIGYGETQGS